MCKALWRQFLVENVTNSNISQHKTQNENNRKPYNFLNFF